MPPRTPSSLIPPKLPITTYHFSVLLKRINAKSKMAGAPDSVALLLFFVFWYAGNMKYNEYNTAALTAVGGKTSGLTMTVATMQLGVCLVYAIITWAVQLNPARLFGLQPPEKQNVPQVTSGDLIKSIPLAFCAAGAHAATVFALGGDPLFGQIGAYESYDAE